MPLPLRSPARVSNGGRRSKDGTVDQTMIEERLAHLIRAVDDLSDIVTRQQGDIDRLTRRVAMLMEREAGREADAASPPDPSQRPPHW